jgi:hypothetical protein
MKSWTERAVQIFAKEVQNGTVKTDETPDLGLSSVSSVQDLMLIEDFLNQKTSSGDQDCAKSYSALWCFPNSSAMNADEIGQVQYQYFDKQGNRVGYGKGFYDQFWLNAIQIPLKLDFLFLSRKH